MSLPGNLSSVEIIICRFSEASRQVKQLDGFIDAMIAKFEEVTGNPEETALMLGDYMIVNDRNLQVIEPSSSVG
jgi:hypothetical protein